MQNESTPDARGPVFCGVDTHADSHWLYVLDWRGRRVLSRRFPADAAGYEALAGAIAAAGEPACIAMEGTSSYGAGLTRHLASLGMPVREALSPAGMQRRRPGQGKCDEADAERAARAAMSGSRLGTPKSQNGWVDGVRCMLAARSGAVKARTSAINTARSLLTTAPEGLRSRFRGMGGPRLMEELPSVRAEGALGAALGALADLWAAAPARDQEARGRLGARGGQARGEGQPGEGGVHTGHQREVHLDAGEGPKGAQAHKEGLRGMGRGRTSARLGQAGLRGRAQNGF